MAMADDSIGVDVEAANAKRTRAAATEYLYPYHIAPGMYEVYSEDGSTKTVDLTEGRCTCHDHQYRHASGIVCKHRQRLELALGMRELPDDLEIEDLDPVLADRRPIRAHFGLANEDDDVLEEPGGEGR